jgi:hypothetical protein
MERNKPTVLRRIFAVVFMALWPLAALLGSCSFLAEKTGRVLDGSAFTEKKLAERYYSTAGNMELRRVLFKSTGNGDVGDHADGGGFIEGFVLIHKDWPNLSFYLVPSNNDTTELYLHSCRFFCSGVSGWNEFVLELSGNGEFIPSTPAPGTDGNETASVLKLEHIEPVTISWGKIRDGDTRISGQDALPVLRNRWERLLAMAEWMHGENAKNNGDAGVGTGISFADLESFGNHWKPLLLPETVPKRERPADYTALASLEQWNRAEDIKWNTAYTAAHFPEDLGELRNQGAFLRDWEEALPWLYLAYEWDALVQRISLNTFY